MATPPEGYVESISGELVNPTASQFEDRLTETVNTAKIIPPPANPETEPGKISDGSLVLENPQVPENSEVPKNPDPEL